MRGRVLAGPTKVTALPHASLTLLLSFSTHLRAFAPAIPSARSTLPRNQLSFRSQTKHVQLMEPYQIQTLSLAWVRIAPGGLYLRTP